MDRVEQAAVPAERRADCILARESEPPRPGRAALTLALAILAYAAVVIYVAWPLPRAAAAALPDPPPAAAQAWARADLDLLAWILAWDAHAVLTQPLRLFQANILYPAPNVLASSEHLLGFLPVAGPTYLLSGNAVLTYNITVMVTVLVTEVTTFSLVYAWTGKWAASFLAGVAFALAPGTLLSWTRLHVTAVHLFPLVLLLAWRAAARPRAGTFAALAAVTALQLLAGMYVAYELLALLLGFAPAVWWEGRRRGRSGFAPLLVIGAGALVLAPVSIPYLRAQAVGTLPDYSRVAVATLRPAALAAVAAGLAADITWPVVTLAIVGTIASTIVPWHLRTGLLVVVALGLVLSLGPSFPVAWALAAHLLPGFTTMRAPARFLVLSRLGIALLAGIGAAELARRLAKGARRAGPLSGGFLILAGTLALVVARKPADGVRLAPVDLSGPQMDVYRWLAARKERLPVLELPPSSSPMDLARLVDTGRYMLGSTLHWLPLINGYTGHPPASAGLLMALAERLPDSTAFADLCDLTGVGWIVVHLGQMRGGRAGWESAEGELPITRVAQFGDDVVYRVDESCGRLRPVLVRQLAGGQRGVSLRGVPLSPLPRQARRGRVEGNVPTTFPAGLHVRLWVNVTNESSRWWPGLTVRREGAVALQVVWRNPTTGSIELQALPSPLACDLGPGETVRAQAGSMVPRPGRYVLEIGLVQVGAGAFGDRSGGARPLRALVSAVPTGPPRPAARIPSTAHCAASAACAGS